jgi:SAM-dependent MidA family methyltransferase
MVSLSDRITREGPVRFDVAMELLLYGEGGFFTRGAGSGRRADFITSPELGPLFGDVVARALDAEWERLGRPDPYVVIEAGAGRGALARSVIDARPACAPAMRYVCVERSPVLRDLLATALPIEVPSNAWGATGGDDAEPVIAEGAGPIVTVLDELPLVPVTGVVIANELLDNVPFRVLERSAAGWDEILVSGDGEVAVRAPDDAAAEAERLAPVAPAGARIPLQRGAEDWLRRALALLERGRLNVVDYASDTATMAARPWTDWLRTYRGHERGDHPLDHRGEQDITCDVAVDQLARVRVPTADRSQADWLREHGIDELAAAARATWDERAAIGDLEALKARSRAGEAAALTDHAGLGAFRVLEWVV